MPLIHSPTNTTRKNTHLSTNELNTLAHDLKELRLMAEQLDTEIKTIEDAIKAHMTEHAVDTLITTDVKITWRTVTSSRIDPTTLKKQLPDIAAVFTRENTPAGSLSSKPNMHKGEARESFPFSSFWQRTYDYRGTRK